MSKGGKQPAEQSSTSQVVLPPWLDAASQQAVSTAQDLSQRPYTPNPNPQVAPATSDQTQAYQQIRDLQGSTAPAYAQAEGALSGGGLLGMTQPITADQVGGSAASLMNPYTQAVVAPTVAAMRQGLASNLQGIAANANAAGAYGGTRQGVAEGVARAQEAIGEGQLTGGLLSQGWQQALPIASNMAGTNLQAGLTADQLLPSLATAGAGEAAREAGLLQTVGTAQQQQSQAEMDAANNAWYAQQNWPVQNLDLLTSTLAGIPYGSTTTTNQQTQYKSNTAGSALGGAATGAALGTAVMPGIGTAIGAIGGGILGLLGG